MLSHCNVDELYEEYKKAFVLVKVYVFDKKTKESKEGLDKSIVKYTNSQNGIDDSKIKNYMIPLEKLLKVFLAFEKDGFYAFTKGSSVLKLNSTYYKEVV